MLHASTLFKHTSHESINTTRHTKGATTIKIASKSKNAMKFVFFKRFCKFQLLPNSKSQRAK